MNLRSNFAEFIVDQETQSDQKSPLGLVRRNNGMHINSSIMYMCLCLCLLISIPNREENQSINDNSGARVAIKREPHYPYRHPLIKHTHAPQETPI